jgi:hypothetical protein
LELEDLPFNALPRELIILTRRRIMLSFLSRTMRIGANISLTLTLTNAGSPVQARRMIEAVMARRCFFDVYVEAHAIWIRRKGPGFSHDDLLAPMKWPAWQDASKFAEVLTHKKRPVSTICFL